MPTRVGLACLELVDEPGAKAFFMTIFVSNEVSVHVGKASKAQEFREKHMGKMLAPPFSIERLEEMGGLAPTVVTGLGDSWSVACMDVVVSGLGWVGLTGLGAVKVRAWAPPGVEVIVRDPLMPFEARTSTEKYTGAGDKKGTSRCFSLKRDRSRHAGGGGRLHPLLSLPRVFFAHAL